jgi:hypothetical protein
VLSVEGSSDGAPEAPKHVGASWYFKYVVYLENAFRWLFFHHNLKRHGPNCKNINTLCGQNLQLLNVIPALPLGL